MMTTILKSSITRAMDAPSCDSRGLSFLPREVLQSIYCLAENPLMSHVCRRLWIVLPSFAAWTNVAHKAFGVDPQVNEQVILKFLEDYPRWQRRQIDPDSVSHRVRQDHLAEDDKLMQGRICRDWLNTEILRKLRSRLMLRTVKSLYRLAGTEISPSSQSKLTNFLSDVQSERLSPTMADCGFYVPKVKVGAVWSDMISTKTYEFFVLVGSHVILVYICSTNCLGLILQPFMPSQGLFDWIVPGVANFSERSQLLAQELFAIRVDVQQGRNKSTGPWQGHGVDREGYRVVSRHRPDYDDYIISMLDSSSNLGNKISMELVARCLHTVLRYQEPCERFSLKETVPTEHRNKKEAEDRPVFIDHKYYQHVITTGNVIGFRMLLQDNVYLYNPSIYELKKMIWRALLGYDQDSEYSPCPSPRRLRAELNPLLKQAKASGKPEFLEMMVLVHKKAKDLGYDLQDLPEEHTGLNDVTFPRDREGQHFEIFDDSKRKRKRSATD